MKRNRLNVYILCVAILLAALLNPAPAAAQSPGGVVAFAARDGDIYFYHTDGSGLERITADGHLRADLTRSETEVEYTNLSWSPDGRYLAAVRQQSEPQPDRLQITTMVLVYDLQTKQWRQTGKDLRSFSWSPSGTALVYGLPVSNWDSKGPQPPFNGIFQYDLTNGQESEILPAASRPLSFPAYSRTGRYLAYYEVIAMEGLGYFGLYDFETRQSRVWNQDTNFAAASLNWAADDSFVVFDQNTYSPMADSKIYRSGPTFEDITAISPAVEERNFYSPRLSPTQDRVLALSDRVVNGVAEPGFAQVWIFNLDGSDAREVLAPTAPLYFFQWMGDGQHMVFSSGDYRAESIQILDVDSGKVDLLGRGREFAVQPGAVFGSAQATPPPVATELPTGEPIAALTATPAGLAQTSTPAPVPPDRVLPPFPPLLMVLLCAGALALLLVVGVVFVVVRRR